MLAATINLRDASLVGNLNFRRFELVLQSGQTESSVLAFAPTVDGTIVTAKEARIAAAGHLADMSHRDILDQNG